MSYFGVLTKVWDNKTKTEPHKPYWGLVIDTEAKGETTFNLWDVTLAGITSKDGEEPSCDVHDFEGKRVMFDCQAGKPKPDGSGNYPATITLIELAQDVAPVGSLLADEGRDANVESQMGIAQHLEAMQRHLSAALELTKKA